eukprot:CAMPEP_0116854640 /NCGR_PEP_ID=MMETSP0418-20121206/18737_1 /TAXON_ID=1158023 /ORGANISM="Astrosyne radiata, Strain 13vi08-1A" /LENGTH=30 /DNA_ID= /DNA_START= /DNA_END= /DNA_ORIENTATION=
MDAKDVKDAKAIDEIIKNTKKLSLKDESEI